MSLYCRDKANIIRKEIAMHAPLTARINVSANSRYGLLARVKLYFNLRLTPLECGWVKWCWGKYAPKS